MSINYDGLLTQILGGTTFLTNASINGDMNPAILCVPSGGWGGIRTRSTLPAIFITGAFTTNPDSERCFW
ncbi:hypothetical protein CS542_01915 [Pedobacter sp. IW39]|nr:hypothetical protein CS542_01915 [Pedobacter sp. IW39]